MQKICLLILAISIGITGFGQKTINDPNAEVRAVGSFHGINVSNAFDVYLNQGGEEAVAISAADQDTKSRIEVEVKDGILVIKLKKGNWKWNNRDKKLRAYISFKSISTLTISGACDVFVEGTLKSEDLKMNLSGASDLKTATVEVKNLSVNISGASDMRINGTVGQLSIDVSGASKFRGADLATDICDAKASGASDITITVNKELSAHANGASGIRYKGAGVITDIKTSGSSKISKI